MSNMNTLGHTKLNLMTEGVAIAPEAREVLQGSLIEEADGDTLHLSLAEDFFFPPRSGNARKNHGSPPAKPISCWNPIAASRKSSHLATPFFKIRAQKPDR